MKRTIIAIIVLTGLIAFAGTSFEFRSGTTAFDFLKIPIGAVNLAMNQCSIASIDNSLAALINPSRLDETPNWDLRAGTTNWILDTSYQYIAFSKRISQKLGAIGIVLRNFNYGEFEYTKPWGYEVDPSEDGNTFTGGALASTLAWGAKLTKNFNFGFSVTYVLETLENFQMDAVLFNVGFMYENKEYLPGLRLGFLAENFGTNVTYFKEEETFTMPLVMKYALHWDTFRSGVHRLTLEMNAAQYKDQDIYGTVGATYSYNSMVFIYTGLTSNPIYLAFAGGVGLKFRMGRSFYDATVAYTMPRNFGGKLTFEIGVMTF